MPTFQNPTYQCWVSPLLLLNIPIRSASSSKIWLPLLLQKEPCIQHQCYWVLHTIASLTISYEPPQSPPKSASTNPLISFEWASYYSLKFNMFVQLRLAREWNANVEYKLQRNRNNAHIALISISTLLLNVNVNLQIIQLHFNKFINYSCFILAKLLVNMSTTICSVRQYCKHISFSLTNSRTWCKRMSMCLLNW